MQIAVLTFDAFNEMDSFVSATLLNRLSAHGWRAYITAPTERVTSSNGIVVEAQRPLEFTAEADAVIFGSGRRTDAVADDPAMLARMAVDPRRQLLVGQCSGALVMNALGLLDGVPACTDLVTRPRLEKRGQTVLDQAFHANGNVATAGGCLSSQYIVAWIISRGLGIERAAHIIRYAAPVGQQDEYVERAIAAVRPFLPARATSRDAADELSACRLDATPLR